MKIFFNLYEMRTTKRKTQIQLAKISGISQSHISELELKKESPTIKTWESLSNALKVHPLELLEFKEY